MGLNSRQTDTLYINCPACGKMMAFKSKIGTGKPFNRDDIPPSVAGDLHGETAQCGECFNAARISTTVIIQVYLT